MDRYQKVSKKKAETSLNENEIRITSQGIVRNYISYATSLLQEKVGSEIVLQGMGQAINKAVNVAEILKRRIPGLYQDTVISSVKIIDEYEPIEEGLCRVEETRNVSTITITLSTEELKKTSAGYQVPTTVQQPRPQYKDQRQPRPQYKDQQQPRPQYKDQQQPRPRYNNQQQPRPQYNNQQQQQHPRQALQPYNANYEDSYGRGRGQGYSRDRYQNYQENDGYANRSQGGGGRARGWGYSGNGSGRGRSGGGRGYSGDRAQTGNRAKSGDNQP